MNIKHKTDSSLKKETDREKLMDQFMKENPSVLDDDIPNKFDAWVVEQK